MGKRTKIMLLNRNHEIFRRPTLFITPNSITVIPKPKHIIICDGCNDLITSDYIKCVTFDGGKSIHSAQCEKCIKKFFSKIPIDKEVYD